MKMTLTTLALTLGLVLVGCNDDAYDDDLYDGQSEMVLDTETEYDAASDYDAGLPNSADDRYEASKPAMNEPASPSAEVSGDTDALFAEPADDAATQDPKMAAQADASEEAEADASATETAGEKSDKTNANNNNDQSKDKSDTETANDADADASAAAEETGEDGPVVKEVE